MKGTNASMAFCGGKRKPKNQMKTKDSEISASWISDACKSANLTCNATEVFLPVEPEDASFPTDILAKYNSSGAVILHIIGVFYMFYALALVCDYFFVPSLDVIIETFAISDDVAGATFMAAGGSAPELFTSIIGVFIAVSDVGIGTIVGSAVFNVLFVIAACAFASKEALSLTAWPLIRDTFFYSVALIVLVIFFIDDAIKWWEALILFLWYFAYVIFMKFNPVMEEKFLSFFPTLRKADPDAGKHPRLLRNVRLLELMGNKLEGPSEKTELVNSTSGIQGLKAQLEGSEMNKDTPKLETEKKKENKENTEEEKTLVENTKKDVYVDYIRSGPPDGGLSKTMWYISLPIMAPMWLTIPDPQSPKTKRFFPLAFIVSILWIAVFSYFMVWWAGIVGETIGISDAVMGLTLLAAGTSVPDLITSVLVAKEGKGDMAVSSSIGSNLFDVTVGLPLPWLLFTVINGKDMQVNSTGMGCSIGMLFLMLVLVFFSILLFSWKMTKQMGGIMLVLYVIFVIVSLGLSECWFPCFF